MVDKVDFLGQNSSELPKVSVIDFRINVEVPRMIEEYFRNLCLPTPRSCHVTLLYLDVMLNFLVPFLNIQFVPLKIGSCKHCRVVHQTEGQETKIRYRFLCLFAPKSDFFVLQLSDRKVLREESLNVDQRRLKRKVVLKCVLYAFFVAHLEESHVRLKKQG
jgi:hypothetical protein